MNKILNIQCLPSKYHFGDFGEAISSFNTVMSLTLESTFNAIELFMTLKDSENNKVVIQFSDVCDLDISKIDTSNFEINVLYIEDISIQQLEGIIWEVKNYEDFKLYFKCKSIKILEYINYKNPV